MRLIFKKERIFRICRQCGNSIPKKKKILKFNNKIVCRGCLSKLKRKSAIVVAENQSGAIVMER